MIGEQLYEELFLTSQILVISLYQKSDYSFHMGLFREERGVDFPLYILGRTSQSSHPPSVDRRFRLRCFCIPIESDSCDPFTVNS